MRRDLCASDFETIRNPATQAFPNRPREQLLVAVARETCDQDRNASTSQHLPRIIPKQGNITKELRSLAALVTSGDQNWTLQRRVKLIENLYIQPSGERPASLQHCHACFLTLDITDCRLGCFREFATCGEADHSNGREEGCQSHIDEAGTALWCCLSGFEIEPAGLLGTACLLHTFRNASHLSDRLRQRNGITSAHGWN